VWGRLGARLYAVNAAALLKSWGSRGPTKLAGAYAKLDAMVEAVSDADASAAEAWIRKMSKAQRVATVRALAG